MRGRLPIAPACVSRASAHFPCDVLHRSCLMPYTPQRANRHPGQATWGFLLNVLGELFFSQGLTWTSEKGH